MRIIVNFFTPEYSGHLATVMEYSCTVNSSELAIVLRHFLKLTISVLKLMQYQFSTDIPHQFDSFSIIYIYSQNLSRKYFTYVCQCFVTCT